MQRIYQTSGRGFEVFMEGFFVDQHNEVELTPATRDGGRDLILRKSPGGPVDTVVELKLWRENNVGVDVIDATFSAMTRNKAKHGLIITTSQFTKPALERAKEFGIECWDGRKLLEELYKHQYFKSPA
jgi:HJR/Mrr/RecB family endonuclease